jgi:hypothetical protein
MAPYTLKRAAWKQRCPESLKATALLELPRRRSICRLCGQPHGFIVSGPHIVVRPHNKPRR